MYCLKTAIKYISIVNKCCLIKFISSSSSSRYSCLFFFTSLPLSSPLESSLSIFFYAFQCSYVLNSYRTLFNIIFSTFILFLDVLIFFYYLAFYHYFHECILTHITYFTFYCYLFHLSCSCISQSLTCILKQI